MDFRSFIFVAMEYEYYSITTLFLFFFCFHQVNHSTDISCDWSDREMNLNTWHQRKNAYFVCLGLWTMWYTACTHNKNLHYIFLYLICRSFLIIFRLLLSIVWLNVQNAMKVNIFFQISKSFRTVVVWTTQRTNGTDERWKEKVIKIPNIQKTIWILLCKFILQWPFYHLLFYVCSK